MTSTETPVVKECRCPVPGCTWFVYASRGYGAPRLDRHQRSDCPKTEEETTR